MSKLTEEKNKIVIFVSRKRKGFTKYTISDRCVYPLTKSPLQGNDTSSHFDILITDSIDIQQSMLLSHWKQCNDCIHSCLRTQSGGDSDSGDRV